MLRTYKAKSILSFNVTFDGKTRNISFLTSSHGGSYFTTSDKELISVIEQHSWFGRKFFKDEENCEDDVYAKDVTNMDELIDEAAQESASGEQQEFTNVEEITNLPDAQKYLQDKGVALRYIRSKAQVMRKAEQLGIRFPNLS